MSQTKRNSFIEAVSNTFVGFLTTLVFSPIIYKICGVQISIFQMSYATLLFTVLSIIRGYIIRRWFNKKKN